jgi:L-amino acid N-acyltransferase YncA
VSAPTQQQNSNPVTLIDLCDEDAKRAAAVAHAAICDTADGPVSPTTLKRYASVPAWQRLIRDRTAVGATVDGVLVGVATVHMTSAGVAYLAMANVTRRRCGIGRLLTQRRLGIAAAAGAHTVTAHVHTANVASMRNLDHFAFDNGPVDNNGVMLRTLHLPGSH